MGRSGIVGKPVSELAPADLEKERLRCEGLIAVTGRSIVAKQVRKRLLEIEKRLGIAGLPSPTPNTGEAMIPGPKARSQVMYIEYKGGGLARVGRIGRVTFSGSGKTLYYKGKVFQSLKGGYKANFFDLKTGVTYWISGCKQSGQDTLYPGTIEIDEDVREEYWRTIRGLPERVKERSFRSEGKYSKRKPK